MWIFMSCLKLTKHAYGKTFSVRYCAGCFLLALKSLPHPYVKHSLSKCVSASHPFWAKCSYIPSIIFNCCFLLWLISFDQKNKQTNKKQLKIIALFAFQTVWSLKTWVMLRFDTWQKAVRSCWQKILLFYLCIMRQGTSRKTDNILRGITISLFLE